VIDAPNTRLLKNLPPVFITSLLTRRQTRLPKHCRRHGISQQFYIYLSSIISIKNIPNSVKLFFVHGVRTHWTERVNNPEAYPENIDVTAERFSGCLCKGSKVRARSYRNERVCNPERLVLSLSKD